MFRRVALILGRMGLGLIFIVSVVFACGVLWFQSRPTVVGALAVFVWLMLAGFLSYWFVRLRDQRVLFAYAILFGAIVAWFWSIAPRNDRSWSPEMARTLTYTRDGDEIAVSNVRNFAWTGPATADEIWETRRYDLTKVKSVDVMTLYWMGPAIGHTYFSFGFEDGEQLAFSIEIRKELGETYSPVAGFFKAYEISVLAGDERDFIGWRVYFPEEDIQLFRTRATPAQARRLLIEFLDLANGLDRTPAYYNTLTDNCTTEAWMLTDALDAGRPFDRRMLLSGYLPELLHELQLLGPRSLEDLRRTSHVLPRAKVALDAKLDGPGFSAAIREGIPELAPQRSAAAVRAMASMRGQSRASMASLGASHEPPTEITLGSAR